MLIVRPAVAFVSATHREICAANIRAALLQASLVLPPELEVVKLRCSDLARAEVQAVDPT